jgi:hypothetical protein
MTTLALRSLAIGTLATFIVAGTAAGQATSPVLNTLEVQKLVTSSEPADNAKLSAHFAALADRYAAEAGRHDAMARSFVGNPNRTMGSGMSIHCRKLSELNNETATTLRELARHHRDRAAGVASTAPRAGAPFQGGEGAPEPTEAELKALAAKASTPADHRALAEYFLTAAKRYAADAEEHAAMATGYRGTRIAQAASHCDRLVKLGRDAADEATGMAAHLRHLGGLGR